MCHFEAGEEKMKCVRFFSERSWETLEGEKKCVYEMIFFKEWTRREQKTEEMKKKV